MLMLKLWAQACLKYFALVLFIFLYEAMPVAAQTTGIKPLQWPFYDPNGCDSSATANPTTSSNNSIYLLGDSLLEGAFYTTGDLKDNLNSNKWDPTADASAGRSITTPGVDPTNNRQGHEQSGLEAIDTDADIIKSASAVVVELGTNTSGTATQFEDQMKRVVKKVKDLNKTTQIYWVNIVSTSNPIYSRYNDVIDNVSKQENFKVIPAKSKDIELGGDKTHPTIAGYRKYSQAISGALGVANQTSGAAASASCCDNSGDFSGTGNNKKDIFDFFLSKGLSPPQAAGVYGNIMHESHGDPQNIQDSYGGRSKNPDDAGAGGWGLIQWTPGHKIIDMAKTAGVDGPIYELQSQLDLIWQHMNNHPDVTGHFDLAHYKTINDPADAADYFEEVIEGAGVPALEDRERHAREGLAAFGSDSASSPGSDSASDCGSSDVNTGDPNFKIIKLKNPLPGPGGQIIPKGVTLHWWGSGSGGRGIDALVSFLRGNSSCGSSGCSVQLGITADGKVYQLTKNLTDLAWHATGGNQTTIGIEIEGGPADFGKAGITKYPEKFNAVVATVNYLVKKYNMPIPGKVVCDDVSGVHPHKAYNSCPGASTKQDIDDDYFNAVMQKVSR
jgi:lysophospholipase L1-like esterase